MEYLRLAFAITVVFASGTALLNLALRASGPDGVFACGGRLSRAALAFMLGLGAVSLQMFIYYSGGVAPGVVSITLPWAVICPISFFLLKGRARPAAPAEGACRRSPGWLKAAALAVIASQAAYIFLFSTLLPVRGWDSWGIWVFKARAFFVDGGVNPGFLLDPSYSYMHPDYPLMIPLSITWLYTAMGALDETIVKIIYPLQYLSLVLIFRYAAKRVSGGAAATVFTALLSVTPIVLIHAAGVPVRVGPLYIGDFVGYSDLALSVSFLAAGSFMHMYLSEGRPVDAVLTALFLAVGAWTKNEGMPYAAIALLLLAASAVHGRGRGVKPLIAAAAIVLAFALPWAVYKAHYGIGSEYAGNLSLAVVTANLSRISPVLKRMLSFMFLTIDVFNFTWWLYAASLIVNARALKNKAHLFVNVLLWGQFSAYIFAYVITPADVSWQLSTSPERLLLHLTPLAMLIAVINVSAFLGLNAKTSRAERL